MNLQISTQLQHFGLYGYISDLTFLGLGTLIYKMVYSFPRAAGTDFTN